MSDEFERTSPEQADVQPDVVLSAAHEETKDRSDTAQSAIDMIMHYFPGTEVVFSEEDNQITIKCD